jgi:acetate kinase
MTYSIPVLNAGSSSIKFALYEATTLTPICAGQIEEIGHTAQFVLTGETDAGLHARIGTPPATDTHEALSAWLLQALPRGFPNVAVVAAGHRVVHGGQAYADPVVVDQRVIAALQRLIPLAPNHQPHNIAPIVAICRLWPGMPQIACFDTAFHRTQPRVAQLFALPRHLTEEGIVRYGFHGLSYEYISGILPDTIGQRARARVIIAHLGHGASMCALEAGRSVATTMGFTVLDGLVMGKRCGALDPGVILHPLQENGMIAPEVADLLNNRSGLLGVSGISDDVRDLEESADPRAQDALDLFAYRAIREIGSLAAALGGLDALVFTAAIGARSAVVRERICDGLGWLGVSLDQRANARNGPKISKERSTVESIAIPTDEEIVIARATRKRALSLGQHID